MKQKEKKKKKTQNMFFDDIKIHMIGKRIRSICS